MLTNHPTTTAALSLSLLSLIFALAVIPSNIMTETNAEPTSYTTNLASGIWIDSENNIGNASSYSKAPFTINKVQYSFLFSAGYLDNGTTPRLGSHNADAALYHDFDHQTLAPFRHLTNGRNAVLVLNQSLLNAKVTQLTFAVTQVVNGHQYVDLIYSLNDGIHWQFAPVSSGYTRDGLSITFNHAIPGNRLRIGIMTRYEYITNPYRYLLNPSLSFVYQGLSDVEEAASLGALVAAYTPCTSDEDNLLQTTEAVAENLKQQYLGLSQEAKAIFDLSEITAGNSHISRLNFILDKHALSLNNVGLPRTSQQEHRHSQLVLIPFLIIGIIGYGITRRKTN